MGSALRMAPVILSLALCGGAGAAEWQTEKILVRLVDDDGRPVNEAAIGMGVTGGGPKGIARGLTDSNGLFAAKLTMVGSLYLRAEKCGHYRTSGELWDGPSSSQRAPPTNEYTVVLKRIINPVPMVVRDVAVTMPALGTSCAFDFLVGDWVAPHGTGLVADCTMSGWKDVKGQRNWDWKCQFLFGDRSGLVHHRAPGRSSLSIRSDLVPPQVAPEDGYDRSLKLEESFHTGISRYESAGPGDHWIFRVRPVTNHQGRVVEAYVGWIEGAVRLEGRTSETLWLGFRYHLNTNPLSRSLEPGKF